ncbi:hypothetical protein [Halobacillus andaensis]|uniref:hypothetical protein n=1 Tax=Halobacillus andaensis TaxID=1176239 RepID=UPI003D736B95
MGYISEEKKDKIFEEKLTRLWNNGYISQQEYKSLKEANQLYINDSKVSQSLKAETDEVKIEEWELKEKPVSEVPKKEKRIKSTEEIRERNITWSLILGVSLLLITGLIVATSQWAQMGPGMKVFAIAGVSLLFFGLSYISGRILKIKQTAFAFLTLGSLFIPIGILTIGYFELLGSYFSLFGEGRFLLGLTGALLPLPLYIRHGLAHNSRLFVWISFLFLTLSAGCVAGALPVSVDVFYLLLMLFNGALVFGYVRYKDANKLKLFMEELPLYGQLNLVISTLLMLLFFESEVFYSFNLIITAAIYMAMVFVYQQKEYQFVFSVMISYAVYMLIEHTMLHSAGLVLYGLVGLVYLVFSYVFRKHSNIDKVFRYTSGIVSFLAFVYISYESIALRGEESSWQLLAAYAVIASNYLVLANITKFTAFVYGAPVFLFVFLWQLWTLVNIGPLFFFMFAGACLSLVYIGLWTVNPWIKIIEESTFYVSLLIAAGSVWYALYSELYGYSACMFLIIGIIAGFVREINQKDIQDAAAWTHSITLLMAGWLWYNPVVTWEPAYERVFSQPFHLSIIGLMLLCLHLFWRRRDKLKLAQAVFYTGQCAYILAMVLLLHSPGVDGVIVRPLILLIGIGVMFWFVQYLKQSFMWCIVSLTSLAFYISLLNPLPIDSFESFLVYLIFAPVFLLLAAELGCRKWRDMYPYFYWLGHTVQPLIIALFMLEHLSAAKVHPVILLIPLSVYLFSAIRAVNEWQIKLMTYTGLTVMALLFYSDPDIMTFGLKQMRNMLFLLRALLLLCYG